MQSQAKETRWLTNEADERREADDGRARELELAGVEGDRAARADLRERPVGVVHDRGQQQDPARTALPQQQTQIQPRLVQHYSVRNRRSRHLHREHDEAAQLLLNRHTAKVRLARAHCHLVHVATKLQRTSISKHTNAQEAGLHSMEGSRH